MRCPACKATTSRVIDSRPSHDGAQIRRRRACSKCRHRFTTYETLEDVELLVVKRDGRREEFNRQKLLNGLIKACEKRPVPLERLEGLVDEIVAGLREGNAREVPVQRIGDLVLENLSRLDTIAYVRFVSVYRNFREPEDFLREVEHLFTGGGPRPRARRPADGGASPSPVPREPVRVPIKRVRPGDRPLPRYAKAGDAGVDLCNAGGLVVVAPGRRAVIPTGVAVAVPPGYELQIRPRSGLARDHGLTVANTPGTVDAGYRGEVGVIVLNTDLEKSVTLKPGDRVAQAVLARCETIAWEPVEELDATERGGGGFGSTGTGGHGA